MSDVYDNDSILYLGN